MDSSIEKSDTDDCKFPTERIKSRIVICFLYGEPGNFISKKSKQFELFQISIGLYCFILYSHSLSRIFKRNYGLQFSFWFLVWFNTMVSLSLIIDSFPLDSDEQINPTCYYMHNWYTMHKPCKGWNLIGNCN